MYFLPVSGLQLHLLLLGQFPESKMVTTLHTAEKIRDILHLFLLSTAYLDIQQFYYYSTNIYYLSEYAGKKNVFPEQTETFAAYSSIFN